MLVNDGLFAALKRETSDLHRQIEARNLILKPTFTLEQYQQLLSRLWRFYSPLEASIADFVDRRVDDFCMSERYKCTWLLADLKSLHMPIDDTNSWDIYDDTNRIKSTAALVGILYVIEGSTLGAQIIRRLLNTKLGLSDAQMRFFIGYDGLTLEQWSRFRSIASSLVSEAEEKEAVDQAVKIFTALMPCYIDRTNI